MKQRTSHILLSLLIIQLLINCTFIRHDQYLNYVNEVDYDKETYALFYYDNIISEPSYYVLRFKKNEEPEDFIFKSAINKNRTSEEYKEFRKRVLLEHYDKTKEKNPQVKILDNDYLVVEREGLLFAMYDLKKQKAIFNEGNPFGVWGSQNIWAEKGTDYKGDINKNEKSDYGIWVKKNIEDSIFIYINENK